MAPREKHKSSPAHRTPTAASSPSSLDFDPVPPLDIRKGPVRSYLVTNPPSNLDKLRTVASIKELVLLGVLITFVCFIRLHKLSWPDSVVFDEVHFGKFAAYYIKGQFFMDVHPPLAKMLYGAIGNLAGFQGNFLFESIGDKFPKNVPYTFMRFYSASLGVGTVLLLYLTLRSSGVRLWVAAVCTLCFAVENAYVTISRYILLDSPLFFFIAATAFAFKKYELYPPLSSSALKSLLATGVALGLASSSKWVGLFTVSWIGILCIWRLWFMIGDLSKPVSTTIKVAISKLVLLLGVPSMLYMFFFWIHFGILTNDSEGSSFFSPEFRSTLMGNTIPKNIQAQVGFDSIVTIRHTGTMGGYLHSHRHNYPEGSQQQQITLYPHLDTNNEWIIESVTDPGVTFASFKNVSNGALIKLIHAGSYCRLHTHDEKAPVSKYADWQSEVTCYGYPGFGGDANDHWVVEIDQKLTPPGEARERIVALKTKFRLRHALRNCYLFSHEVKLPEWGFGQQEVTCASMGRPDLTVWYVEDNHNYELPADTERISYPTPSFFAKFWESHKRMWVINSNLKEPHVYESKAIDWPFLKRGISYWGKERENVYLLGNAIMWWSVSLFVLIFAIVCVAELLAWQLGYPILQDEHIVNFHVQVVHYLLGFLLHWVPSFLMGRQLFLHHYLPAYYFGILALGHAMDIVVTLANRRRKIVGSLAVCLFFVLCFLFFSYYSPLIYGTQWTRGQCERSQWLKGWDYDCSKYPEEISEYNVVALDDNFSTIDQFVNPAETMVQHGVAGNENIQDLLREEAPEIAVGREGAGDLLNN